MESIGVVYNPIMRKKATENKTKAEEVQEWFLAHVTYEGQPYTIDLEQAEAVADESKNAIVVARAGSGKTRTIVAKMVYLIAQKSVKPEEIMAFVFNANAAAEINARLSQMMIDGVPATDGAKVASTFHAFARKVVFDVCNRWEKCGRILADEREGFVLAIVQRMMKEPKWRRKITQFIEGKDKVTVMVDGKERVVEPTVSAKKQLRFAKMMATAIGRAQQKFLGGKVTFLKSARAYLKESEADGREKLFVELSMESFRRYHWYLLDEKERAKLPAQYHEYGTDFNLIMSWAGKLILKKGKGVQELLKGKKYILIDEYQDFSELFLSVVKAILKIVPGAKVLVVGDDWQAINRFAGSEVEYFKGFEKYFEGARRMEITTNYRCDKRVVMMARKFVAGAMKEEGNFEAASKRMGKVVVVDPALFNVKVPLTPWDERAGVKDKIYTEMARKITGGMPKPEMVKYIKAVTEVVAKNRKFESIMILHRNNETNVWGTSLTRFSMGLKWGLKQLLVMDREEFDQKVRVMTMHKSKGLESEVVIILEADEGVIPKTHPDTELYGVFGETEEVALLDQKRLFYVAMTRAKKRLYIIHEGKCTGAGAGFVRFLGRGIEKM